MNLCSRCHQPYTFYSGTDEICLVCKYEDLIDKYVNFCDKYLDAILKKPVPDKLLDDVTKSPIVLEAERIIGGKNV